MDEGRKEIMNKILEKCLMDIEAKAIEKNGALRLLEAYYEESGLLYEAEDEDTCLTNETGDEVIHPKELRRPLEERSGDILDAMNRIIKWGLDLNEGDCYNPLMMAVGYCDAAMTEFLITHGADPNYIPDDDGADSDTNWYYDELDLAYFDEYWKRGNETNRAIMDTAKVLVTKGNLGEYQGYCLKIDTVERKIMVSPPEYLF